MDIRCLECGDTLHAEDSETERILVCSCKNLVITPNLKDNPKRYKLTATNLNNVTLVEKDGFTLGEVVKCQHKCARKMCIGEGMITKFYFGSETAALRVVGKREVCIANLSCLKKIN